MAAGAFPLRHPNSGRPGNHGRDGKAGSPPPGSPRPPSHRSPREGGGRARPGAVTAAPPRSYLGGAALGDALPAGPAAAPGARAQPRSPAAGPAARAQAARAITRARRRGQSGRAGGGLCRRGRPSGFDSGVRLQVPSGRRLWSTVGGSRVPRACGGP